MLVLKNIKKDYVSGEEVVHALKGINLSFRESEFVSILGQSGCGKTTLLNIIGGLDQYTSGDLIINGKSTKDFKDRDWDTYRNHSVGFIFQSYNLISHQTVLSNVELALTLSGVSKEERKKRAIEALEQVGLGDQLYKKPNQMSGGQMQRVAIARALVNNPEILLADEPTGALDTATSVQIMDLLKEIAKDRLVIMVTHNPELAEEYSTRLVRLRDGEILSDSMPYEADGTITSTSNKEKKTSMNFLTALSLSLNNLMTKKARTALTAFAGSIGIIGIALILSLSQGTQDYIDRIQEETLSSYPLTITAETADATAALMSMISTDMESVEGTDKVKETQFIASMFSTVGTNDLPSFLDHIDENKPFIDEMVSLIQYKYAITPVIYNTNGEKLNPSDMMSSVMGGGSSTSSLSALMSSGGGVFNEMLDDPELIKSQYDVLAGRWPEKYNEVLLVLSQPNGISDILVYGLGIRDSDELVSMIRDIMDGKKVTEKNQPMTFTYDDLLNLDLKLVNASDMYRYNEVYDLYEDMSKDVDYMDDVLNQSEDLNIVGIVCLKDGVSSGTLMNGIAYTKELTEHVINKAKNSEIVKKQLENDDINVFSGNPFDEEKKESELNFEDMITIDTEMLASAFGSNISEEEMGQLIQTHMSSISDSINADTVEAKELLEDVLKSMINESLGGYIEENANELGIATLKASQVDLLLSTYFASNHATSQLQRLSDYFGLPIDVFKSMYEPMVKGIVSGYVGMFGPIDENKKETISNAIDGSDLPEEVKTQLKEIVENMNVDDLLTYLNKEEVKNTLEYLETQNGLEKGTIYKIISEGFNEEDASAILSKTILDKVITQMLETEAMDGTMNQIAIEMLEANMQQQILTKVGTLTGTLIEKIAGAMNVDPNKIASAFKFNLTNEELGRLMSAMSSSGVTNNATANLITLGYQNLEEPTSVSFYFKDFEAKEQFIDFLKTYNKKYEDTEDEDKVISYTDITGLLMSSVKDVIDAISYILIAFVSISLVVSSIMIGIITYISVLERTKEIGILRAIGASKKDISRVFNAETFIVGFISGAMGILITVLLNIPINKIVVKLTDIYPIAVLPTIAALVLVLLSLILTTIAGLLPSRIASKKDPVEALRSE